MSEHIEEFLHGRVQEVVLEFPKLVGLVSQPN